MTANVVRLKDENCESHMHCPFTGVLIDAEDGLGSSDHLLFVHVGTAGIYEQVADVVLDALAESGARPSADDISKDPLEVVGALDFDNWVLFEIDRGWNGVDSYAFRL